MNEQSTISRDELWAVATLRRAMADVEPDPDALLVGALARGGHERQRRRRRLSLVAAAAALLLAAGGTLGVVAHDAGTRVAEPAAPPASLVPSPQFDGRAAALYLARLTGRTPTDYDSSANRQAVWASLSFDGHRSKLAIDPRVTTDPTEIEAADISVELQPVSSTWISGMHQDGVWACSGRSLDGCKTSVPTEGTALTTGSALTANGCCAIRGTRVNVVAYQRTDQVVVWAEGRPDMFSMAELTTIAMSPVWDLTATPTAADVKEADAVLPY